MDGTANFAQTTVATAPIPATSGTSFTVAAGTGALFPNPSVAAYNVVRWPANTLPTSSNTEIVRVTALATDTFTMTRSQEGTSAQSWVAGDNVALAVTAKTITDLQGVNSYTSATQTISSTSMANLTGLSGTVAARTYLVYGSVTFIGNQAAGTAIFGFTTPTVGSSALTSAFVGPAGAAAPTTATTSSTPTSPTLTSAGVFVWDFTGIVTFTASGTVQVQAKEGTISDTFTIQAGSYLRMIPLV